MKSNDLMIRLCLVVSCVGCTKSETPQHGIGHTAVSVTVSSKRSQDTVPSGTTSQDHVHTGVLEQESASIRAIRREVAHFHKNRGDTTKAHKDLELTIRTQVQKVVDEEIAVLDKSRGVSESVILVANTTAPGELWALGASKNQLSLAGNSLYRPGSTMKTFSIATALDAKMIKPTDTFSADGVLTIDGRTVRDGVARKQLSVEDILAYSSNVGTTQIFLRLGKEKFLDRFWRFQFGKLPPIEFPFVSEGEPIDKEAQLGKVAQVAYGGSIHTSPLHVLSAFSVLAQDGRYVPMHVVKPKSARSQPETPAILSSQTCTEMLQLLEGVVRRDDGTGKAARIEGIRVAGKTGTAPSNPEDEKSDLYGSFVGLFPVEKPLWIVFIGVRTARGTYSGGSIAAPAFGRLGKKLLGLPPQ